MLAHLLWRGDVSFPTVRRLIPGIHTRTNKELLYAPFPRILKSHGSFNARYPRVIYVVRDGRDVIVSYYHRKVSRGFAYDGFSDFLRRHLKGEVGTDGSWHSHVLGWLDRPEKPSLVLRYEDLKQDAVREMQRVSSLLEINCDQADVATAVKQTEFGRMRSREVEHYKGGQGRSTESGHEIRKGVRGDWRNYFSEADSDLFWKTSGEAMDLAGYVREPSDKGAAADGTTHGRKP
jgi:hypothetical protein